jgi:uncharacterized integral membrane protein (TIGR00698 family)
MTVPRINQILFIAACLLAASGIITPPIALTLGLILALTMGNPYPGLSSRAAKYLLQGSVVGVGAGMNLSIIWQAGRSGVGFTAVTIVGTLIVGLLVGRLLKIERQTSLLVSSGTAICGGSAIAAVGSVINADDRAMSVSLGTVFMLNAVALFVFPPLGHALGLGQEQFGLWAAIAIHDTSSVVGAASHYGEVALHTATTVKLIRALWIVPLALGLSLTRRGGGSRPAYPWFIVFFLMVAAVRTMWPSGEVVYGMVVSVAKMGLCLTLFLIGSGLSRQALRAVGLRPMIQGVVLWIMVAVVSLLVIVSL